MMSIQVLSILNELALIQNEMLSIYSVNPLCGALYIKLEPALFQNELLSLYSVPVSINSLCGSLGVCVRLLEGNITIGDVEGTLLGTSALLFVLPPPVSEDPEWVRPSQLYQWNNGIFYLYLEFE